MAVKTLFSIGTWYCYDFVADIDWIAGYSYIILGPLVYGRSTFTFESVPTRKPWALLGHDPGYARACSYGLPPTAMVDDLRSKRRVLWSSLTENFPDLFRGSLSLHLVNGSSSVIQGDILIDATYVQRLLVFPWFQRREINRAFPVTAG